MPLFPATILTHLILIRSKPRHTIRNDCVMITSLLSNLAELYSVLLTYLLPIKNNEPE